MSAISGGYGNRQRIPWYGNEPTTRVIGDMQTEICLTLINQKEVLSSLFYAAAVAVAAGILGYMLGVAIIEHSLLRGDVAHQR